MNRPLKVTLAATLGAAVAGNALIRKDDLAWMNDLQRPAMQISLPQFAAVGAAYYGILGTVLHRATDRRDTTSAQLALVVMASNEAWNVAFFRRRSTLSGLLGILAFTVPLGALQVSVRKDRTSSAVLAAYTGWVIGYDIPWTYQLWRLNRR
jgi:translocator protein